MAAPREPAAPYSSTARALPRSLRISCSACSKPRRSGASGAPMSEPETLIERSAYLPQTAARGWREQAGGRPHGRAGGGAGHDGAMRTEVDHLVLALAAARHLP